MALGRGQVGHVGRVCIIMRAVGARVRAVVGAGASAEERRGSSAFFFFRFAFSVLASAMHVTLAHNILNCDRETAAGWRNALTYVGARSHIR